MDKVSVIERGYEAVAVGDRDTLQDLFTYDAVWRLMAGLSSPEGFRDKATDGGVIARGSLFSQ